MIKRLVITCALFCIFTSVLKPENKNTYVIKIKNKNEPTIISNTSIKLPAFNQILKNYQKQNVQLSTKLGGIINKLLSYRIADLNDIELKKLESNGSFEIEPNYQFRIEQDNTRPNDPRYGEQWALHYLQAEKVWNIATGKNVIVGVVDTGIEWEHEDLKNQLWINSAEDLNHNGTFEPWDYREFRYGVSGDLNGKDDDGNGFIDDVIGYDFVNQPYQNLGDWSIGDGVPFDENGHGTLVSGVISAEHNNHKGISGLAYDSKIMTMRCFDINGYGNSDNIASAVIYAVTNGAKVLNLSFGEKYNSSLMQDAIDFALESRCAVIASSGNEGSDSPHYPSDYEGVISVGYINKLGKRDNFSNYGQRLSLVAPGVKILTTSFIGDYKEVSGSSLSAPYVSATAALIKQLHPEFNAFDILGNITASATESGNQGWDEKYGAGILNTYNALTMSGITNIKILNPDINEVINKETYLFGALSFTGTIATPLFLNYELYLGTGTNPTDWTKLNESDKQIMNDTLYNLNIDNLKDTNYVFRIKVNLRNFKTLEKRLRFSIISSKSRLQFVNIKYLPVFITGRRIPLLSIETNRETVISVIRSDVSDSSLNTYSDDFIKSKFHVIPIEGNYRNNDIIKLKITAYENIINRKESINSELEFVFKDDNFITDKFIKKPYSTKLTYLYNKAADFKGNGKPEFAANDLTYGVWNGTDIFEYDDNKLTVIDSTKAVHIPVGIGDSNGDGILELFTKDLGSSILFQPKTKDRSVFSSILFADTTSGNLYAGAMFDFTGDGKDELIAYSDTAVYIISYVNNKYQIIATAMNGADYRQIGTLPGILCGDFDGDGKKELCFGNSRGNIFIWQFDNNRLTPEFRNLTDYSDSPQYYAKGDIDNDGKEEIITANFGNSELFGRNVDAPQVWQVKVLKSVEPNNYAYIYGEYFYPVKQGSTPGGIFYRNGISTGNIGTSGDAILFSPFPNFYTFVFDSNTRKIVPFWFYPDAFANSAIVYDFDKNGVNEIGFSTSRGTQFFEYMKNNNPNSVIKIDGWSVSDTSIYLEWKKLKKDNSDSTKKFIITVGKIKNNVIEVQRTVESESSSLLLSGFAPDNDYWFGIESVSLSGNKSEPGTIIVHHHPPIKLVSVKQIDQLRYIFRFSGKVPENLPVASSTFSYSVSFSIYKADVLNRYSDSAFIVSWYNALTPGEGIFLASSFIDYYNAPSISSEVNFRISRDSLAKNEVYLKNINILSFHEIELIYSEPVNVLEAENILNYYLSPTGSIRSIAATSNPNIFQINFDDKSAIGALGSVYSITVKNVKSLNGDLITSGAGNTISFVFSNKDLASVFVYPNPVKLSETPQIYFANLTQNCIVYVYDDKGREIISLTETDGNGGVEWDGRDKHGDLLNTGVYYYKVVNSGSVKVADSPLKKFAIIR